MALVSHILLTEQSRQKLKQALLEQTSKWIDTWFSSHPDEITVEFCPDGRRPFNRFTGLNAFDVCMHSEHGISFYFKRDKLKWYQSQLMRLSVQNLNECGQVLLDAVTEDAFSSLCSLILKSLTNSKATTEKLSFSNVSTKPQYQNALRISISWKGKDFSLILSSALVQGLRSLEKTEAIPPLQISVCSLRHEQLPMTIEISSEKIAIDKLLNLQLGDLIKLDHKLTEPLTLKPLKSESGLTGFLVNSNNRKSLLLVDK